MDQETKETPQNPVDWTIDEIISHVKERDGRDVAWDVAMRLVDEIERHIRRDTGLEELFEPDGQEKLDALKADIAIGLEQAERGESKPVDIDEVIERVRKRRQGGELKGQVEIKPGFNELPEGFVDAFEVDEKAKEGHGD